MLNTITLEEDTLSPESKSNYQDMIAQVLYSDDRGSTGELVYDVQELKAKGNTALSISRLLKVPIEWVEQM
jgi:hypothetical protein